MDANIIPIVGMSIPIVAIVMGIGAGILEKKQKYETIRHAIEKGTQLPPELLEQLNGPRKTPFSDLKTAIILMCVAVATVIFAANLDEQDLYGIAAFPGLIGVGFAISWYLNPARKAEDRNA